MAESTLHPDAVAALSHGNHGAPKDILGVHSLDAKNIVVRAFRPSAKDLYLIDGSKKTSKKIAMERLDEVGFFEISLAGNPDKFSYSLLEVTKDGQEYTFKDPYAFPPLLSDF